PLALPPFPTRRPSDLSGAHVRDPATSTDERLAEHDLYRASLKGKASRRFGGGGRFSGWWFDCRGLRPVRELRQEVADLVAHPAAIDDHVDGSVVQQEFAALEPVGQLLADRLLDDPGAGETDQRLRLRDVHVAK